MNHWPVHRGRTIKPARTFFRPSSWRPIGCHHQRTAVCERRGAPRASLSVGTNWRGLCRFCASSAAPRPATPSTNGVSLPTSRSLYYNMAADSRLSARGALTATGYGKGQRRRPGVIMVVCRPSIVFEPVGPARVERREALEQRPFLLPSVRGGVRRPPCLGAAELGGDRPARLGPAPTARRSRPAQASVVRNSDAPARLSAAN